MDFLPSLFYHVVSLSSNYSMLQVEDPDSFETWEKLVRGAEALEGGINRNSNPQAITTVRHAYDRFLAKFPLLFGYWKKYADLEFSVAGTEAAEMVRTEKEKNLPSYPSCTPDEC